MALAWLPPSLQDIGMGDDSLEATLTHWVTLKQSLGPLVGAHFPTGHPADTSSPLPDSRSGVETRRVAETVDTAEVWSVESWGQILSFLLESHKDAPPDLPG